MNSSGRSIPRLTSKRTYNPAFLHPDDLGRLGVAAGDAVEIRSVHDAVRAVVQPDDGLRPGVVSMTHAFGTDPDDDDRFRILGANTGRLIPVDLDYDPVSGIPRMGALPVAITKLQPQVG